MFLKRPAASVSEPEKDRSHSVVFNNLATIDDLETLGNNNPLAPFSSMGGLIDPMELDIDSAWLTKLDFFPGEYDMAGLDLLIPQVGSL